MQERAYLCAVGKSNAHWQSAFYALRVHSRCTLRVLTISTAQSVLLEPLPKQHWCKHMSNVAATSLLIGGRNERNT